MQMWRLSRHERPYLRNAGRPPKRPIYYALAEREDCPCTVAQLFVERQDWGIATDPPKKGSAWYHLHQHLRRNGIIPLVIRCSPLRDLRPGLRKYGDISGLVLVSQRDKLIAQ